MRVKTARPASTRVVSRSAGKQPRKLKPLDLPEDDNDFRPRGRKKRSKDQTKESDAKRREAFDDREAFADDLLNSVDDEDDEGKIASVFQTSFASIKKQMEKEGLAIEDSSTAYYRTCLALIHDLMPLAEKNYRTTGKEGAAYVISTLINQARDLTNDLRLAEDVEGKLVVIRSLVHTSFVRIAELLLREKYAMHNTIDGITSNATIRKAFRKELDSMIMSYGKGLKDFEMLLGKQVGAYLSGDPQYLSAGSDREETEEPKKKRKGRKKSG
jgi:hypothetical protein